ncbi:MAG: LLM class flavin-dependent oxidoreductase [Acidimicrobiia bacterium]|nr:LLM class flavin-dependent oxidoreductase [Acidimicrobiia bacterium]
MATIPLSVLDLAMVRDNATTGEALAETTKVAQAADRLGYRRFWVAEHHNMPTVASTSPSVLIAHLASTTHRIRIGSGGVMLPNHSPLVVAEQFAMLEALYPGRIDLGIGRAPGTDRATMVALRRHSPGSEEEEFPRNVLHVMSMLGDHRAEHNPPVHLVATPAAGSFPSIFLLGSSGFSAQLAGILGLPFGFAHHFEMGGTLQAAEIYHDSFTASPVLEEPHLIVTATAVVGPSDEKAEWLASPSRLRRAGLRRGRLLPLLPPDDAIRHPEYPGADQSAGLIGTVQTVVDGMAGLAADTGAAELMLYPVAYDVADRIGTLEEVAGAWGPASDASAQPA